MKTELAVIVDDDDGATCDLAAGAAGGGYGNQRCDLVRDARRAAFDGGIAGEGAIVRRGDRDALGAVDRGTAAHGDEPVATLGLVDVGCSAHRGFRRIG